MRTHNRRDFLAESVALGALGMGVAAKPAQAASRQSGANDAIRIGVVGLHGKGAHHIEMFKAVPGVRLAALCDPDENVLSKAVTGLATENIKVQPFADIRKLLESKEIDAISIATPNHWHSLMTVWACQAGKDVYVEKPVSHSVWEGRKAVEAGEKYGRIVQAGTQSRSDTALQELAQLLKRGELGKIRCIRGFCYKRRQSIGNVTGPQPIPSGINYDLWTGPAPLEPLRRAQLHYDWHWVWPTGNGDIGNQGVHEMDMCRWMGGYDTLPPQVFSIGGRFGYDDDAETPNTLISILDYKPAPIIFEVRGLPQASGSESMSNYRGVRIGVVVECENGYFAGGGGGGWIYDTSGKRVKQLASTGGDAHVGNFIQAVRSRKRSDLTADIHEGHLSSALCHLGNISHRLGTELSGAEIRDRVKSRAEIADTFARFSEHLTANGVDVSKTSPVLGPVLEMAPEQERFKTESEYDLGAWANQLIKDKYRSPYVVPEEV